MDTISGTEARLLRQRSQIDARLEGISARKAAEARKLDTRRKIIVGSVILKAMATDPFLADLITYQLDRDVQKLRDREVLGLPPQG